MFEIFNRKNTLTDLNKKPWLIEQPRRAAIIVRTPEEREQAIEHLKATKGLFRFPPQDSRVFCISGGKAGFPLNYEDVSSLFHTSMPRLFDLVYIDRKIKLFDNPYGINFINLVSQLVAENCILVLPIWDSPKSGGISIDRLTKVLGTKGKSFKKTGLIAFTGDFQNISESPSVLSWYSEQGAQLVIEEIYFRGNNDYLSKLLDDPVVAEFLIMGELVTGEFRGSRSGQEGNEACGFGPKNSEGLYCNIDDIIISHSYLISGLSYKAALIRHIIDELMPNAMALRYADIGGGFGALAAELLLSYGDQKFEKVITRDIATQNILLARSLFCGLYQPLKGRFKFSLGPAETFPFEQGFNVISFIGSLLYVDKKRLVSMLDAVWQSLSPGGIIIVHENIKNPSYARDFDVMFESSELDNLLGQYGNIRYFHSSVFSELSQESIGEKTVFRVLQKRIA